MPINALSCKLQAAGCGVQFRTERLESMATALLVSAHQPRCEPEGCDTQRVDDQPALCVSHGDLSPVVHPRWHRELAREGLAVERLRPIHHLVSQIELQDEVGEEEGVDDTVEDKESYVAWAHVVWCLIRQEGNLKGRHDYRDHQKHHQQQVPRPDPFAIPRVDEVSMLCLSQGKALPQRLRLLHKADYWRIDRRIP